MPEREFNSQSVPVLLSCAVGVVLNGVALAVFPFAVFAQPLARELGWTPVQLSAAATLCWIGVAISAPIGGALVARYGARPVQIASAVLTPLVFCSLTAMSHTSLWAFYLAFGMIGLLTPGVLPIGTVISSWFDRHRAKALSTIGIGAGITKSTAPWIAHQLILWTGWRWTYALFGAASLAVLVPLLWLFFRERPAARGKSSVAGALRPVSPTHRPVRLALRSANFWFMIVAEAAVVFGFNGFSANAVAMLAEHGFSTAFSVSVLSTVGAGALVGPAICGYLLDRFDTPRAIVPFAAASLLAVLTLHYSDNRWLVLAAAPLLGIGTSGETSLTSYFVTRYFGVASYGRIYGALVPTVFLAGAPGPIVAAALFQHTGSYFWSFTMIEAAGLIAVLGFGMLGPYVHPSHESLGTSRSSERTTASAETAGNIRLAEQGDSL